MMISPFKMEKTTYASGFICFKMQLEGRKDYVKTIYFIAWPFGLGY